MFVLACGKRIEGTMHGNIQLNFLSLDLCFNDFEARSNFLFSSNFSLLKEVFHFGTNYYYYSYESYFFLRKIEKVTIESA